MDDHTGRAMNPTDSYVLAAGIHGVPFHTDTKLWRVGKAIGREGIQTYTHLSALVFGNLLAALSRLFLRSADDSGAVSDIAMLRHRFANILLSNALLPA